MCVRFVCLLVCCCCCCCCCCCFGSSFRPVGQNGRRLKTRKWETNVWQSVHPSLTVIFVSYFMFFEGLPLRQLIWTFWSLMCKCNKEQSFCLWILNTDKTIKIMTSSIRNLIRRGNSRLSTFILHEQVEEVVPRLVVRKHLPCNVVMIERHNCILWVTHDADIAWLCSLVFPLRSQAIWEVYMCQQAWGGHTGKGCQHFFRVGCMVGMMW